MIDCGSSDLGLSDVKITLELRSVDILPIIALLSLSLSPPLAKKISSFGYKEDKYEIESVVDSYADKIKESIVSIQQNLSDDPHGWRYKVED